MSSKKQQQRGVGASNLRYKKSRASQRICTGARLHPVLRGWCTQPLAHPVRCWHGPLHCLVPSCSVEGALLQHFAANAILQRHGRRQKPQAVVAQRCQFAGTCGRECTSRIKHILKNIKNQNRHWRRQTHCSIPCLPPPPPIYVYV